jgi:hypothetical protein
VPPGYLHWGKIPLDACFLKLLKKALVRDVVPDLVKVVLDAERFGDFSSGGLITA